MVCNGVSSSDFTEIYNDMGVAVSYKVVTRTQNATTGEETTSFATATTATAIVFLEQNRYVWDKDGLLEVGDAYLIAPTTLGVKRYDQVAYNGETYYVDNVTRRTVLGVNMMDFATLFKVN